jgi:hypothetical protein
MEMSIMKDNDLRGVVLKTFYEYRREGHRNWQVSDFLLNIDFSELDRICKQLKEHNYITWQREAERDLNEKGRLIAIGIRGIGRITASGIDVIEGTVQPPISINFDHSQMVTIHGSNNIVGDNNYLSLENVNSEINQSHFSEPEKAEAKSIWRKVCENKLLNTVLGSVVGAATNHALESAHSK